MSRVTQESSDQALTFGPFRLHRARKQLLEGDKPVRLGSRALDLLIALVERAGEVVSREELEACVWPSTIVEETSLRVHISALRKALGDGHGGARFIANVPGRGYCFVAAVARPHETPMPDAIASAHRPPHNLPARLSPMIGRSAAVDALTRLLHEHRFVTVTGPGGMGKTTVALAVADDLLAEYEHGVRFVDLSPIVDPLLLPSTVATALGISVSSHDPLSALSAFLNDRNMLIVLDGCEHVIEAAASLAEKLLRVAPGISVLTTSREPLNAEGEWAYRLSSLETPPASEHLTAAQALTFAAIELFVQRATGIADGFELSRRRRAGPWRSLPAARWHAAGHRVCGGPGRQPRCARTGRRARRSAAAFDARSPHGLATASHAQSAARLELRAAVRARAVACCVGSRCSRPASRSKRPAPSRPTKRRPPPRSSSA